MRKPILALLVLLLPACVAAPRPVPPPVREAPATRADIAPAAARFRAVAERVTPVAEATCRARAPALDCDFLVLVDTRPGLPSNALQTEDRQGRPVIIFTLPLVQEAQNADELAFILGHEAAHHIAGHIPESRRRAAEGALLGTVLAATLGLDASETEVFQRQGAFLSARRYAKSFELEADAIGTVIAARAGYDPVRGAAFFARIPDPGDRFLGTHPPNAERIATVRRVAAGL